MSGVRKQIIRIFVIFSVTMVTIASLLEYVLYLTTANTLKEQLGNKCLGIATSVVTLLEQDTEALRNYIATMDTSSDYYMRTKANLEKIRFGNADNIAFLYVERRVSDSEMMYIFDGEIVGTDTFSPPGSIEPLTTTRKMCYDTAKPYIGDFVTTVWDTLLSAYAPVLDSATGELLAIVGVDVSISQYNVILSSHLTVILINIFIFILLAAMLLLVSSSAVQKRLFKDSLTGVFTRGFFFSSLKAQLRMLKRKDYPAIIFMADIDHFKRINDSYGHPFGDLVLANIADVMKRHMRKGDCLARYGGEEFVAIIAGLDIKASYDVIKRMNSAVSTTITRDETEGREVSVTISIGVAELDKHESADQAVRNADSALYEAKKSRNTIVFHMPESGGYVKYDAGLDAPD